LQEIYEIFDVGGQKTERRKWVHFFDNTAAIIFVAALSEYNQLLWEDNRNNRMEEAIGLFRGIVNLPAFKDSHIILFLNKSDLFKQKVGKYKIKDYFKDYEGNETESEAIEFFKKKFCEQRRGEALNKMVYAHITCATDGDCVKKMFASVRDIVISKELHEGGFL
jgi:GTPase SAR1 family protein